MQDEIAWLKRAEVGIQASLRQQSDVIVEAGKILQHVFDRVLLPLGSEAVRIVVNVTEKEDGVQKFQAPFAATNHENASDQPVGITGEDQITAIRDQSFGTDYMVHNHGVGIYPHDPADLLFQHGVSHGKDFVPRWVSRRVDELVMINKPIVLTFG